MKLLLVYLAASTIAGSAYAADCGDVSENIKAKTAGLQSAFQEKATADRSSFEQQMKAEQDEMPSPSTAEAVLNFKIDIKMKTETIKFDLPAVTMRDNKIVLDLPQVTMKNQKWAFDIPETWMAMQCIPGVPETVCDWIIKDIGFGIKTKMPDCRLRPGKNICTQVPQFKMSRREVVLGVPEIRMDRTEWVMGIPEFKMETQEIKMDIPQITVRDVKGSIQKAQEKMDSKSQDFTAAMTASSARLKADIEQITATEAVAFFSCQRDGLVRQKTEALGEIDKGISIVSSSLAKAREVNATAIAESLEKQLPELISKRAEAEANLDRSIQAFDDEMNNALKNGVSRASGTVKAEL